MKKRIAFRVVAVVTMLGLIGALAGDLVVRHGPFGGWVDIAGDVAWIVTWGFMLANVRTAYLNRTRWQYAADQWKRVAQHWHDQYDKHFIAEHPETPAAPTLLWPGCTLDMGPLGELEDTQ